MKPLLTAALLAVSVSGFAAHPVNEKPRIKYAYSAEWCAPCKPYFARLAADGATSVVIHIKNAPESITKLPTFIYRFSDGTETRDNGERISAGECRLPLSSKPMTIYKQGGDE